MVVLTGRLSGRDKQKSHFPMTRRTNICGVVQNALPATIIILVSYITFQAFYNLIAFKSLLPYTDAGDFWRSVMHNLVPMIALFATNFTLVFRLNRLHNIVYKILTDVIISFIFLTLINLAFLFYMHDTPSAHVDWAGTTFCNTFILMGIEMSFYISHYRKSLQQTEEYKRRVLMYQYNALKAQVNPHFLFNSLNILYSLISIDRQKSRQFVMSLSEMYRYIMTQQDRERTLLEDELRFLRSYVEVLEMRYYHQFKVEIRGEESVRKQEIIPFTMQLLIENVTKHNVISQRYPLTVSVRISENAITVVNPIRPRTSTTSTGIGLRYITDLYRQYGKDFVHCNGGKVFEAVVPFL